MKVYIDWDEAYPVYSLEKADSKPTPIGVPSRLAEVAPSLWARYQRTLTAWRAVQDEIEREAIEQGVKQ